MSDREEARHIHGMVALNTLRPMSTGATRSIRLARAPLRQLGIDLHLVSVRSPLHFLWPFLQGRRLRYDFVLFNGLASLSANSLFAYPLWCAAIRFRLPVFFYWHETEWTLRRQAQEQPRSARRIARMAQHPSVLHLTASGATSDSVRGRFGDVCTVPIYECAHIPQPSAAIHRPAEPPLVVNAATIQPRKGTDLFVETAIKVCREHPTVAFVWMGHGDSFGNWPGQIREAGLEQRILFPGYVNKPHLLLRRASIFFLSSRDDPFPLSVLEAMALGRAVVTFDVGGAPEALAGNGRLIPPFDTDKAAAAILEILALRPADRLQPALRQRYLAHYSPQAFSERLARTIRDRL